MKYDAVIFDLDGTLLDTLEDLADSVNYALEDAGLPGRTIEEVRQFIGDGVRMLITRAASPVDNAEVIQSIHQCFIQHYKENCENKTKPYAGVSMHCISMVSLLQSSPIKRILLSKNWQTNTFLIRLLLLWETETVFHASLRRILFWR